MFGQGIEAEHLSFKREQPHHPTTLNPFHPHPDHLLQPQYNVQSVQMT